MKISRAHLLLPLLFLLSATCVAQDNKKFTYGLLLDNTGSMRSQFDTVREIGKSIVNQIHDHGPVSLFDFHSEGVGSASRAIPILRIDATSDQDTLDRGIDQLYVEGGQTSLLDAVKFIADSIGNQAGDAVKIIILVTDGEDRVSDIQRQTLLKTLKDHGIKVFSVGLVEELDSQHVIIRSGGRKGAIDLLNSLAKETGGRAIFPKGKKIDMASLLTELAIPIH
ncbi:MAG TPA: VWA domain-containing protein [Pyrinomonadaceae bacterium]|nr:VWA domain-containing protein [Pyrinomonadaceae bacterium]